MTHIERSVLIDAAVEDVFSYLATISKHTEWLPNLIDLHNLSNERAIPGMTYDWTFRLIGINFKGTEVVADVVPNEMLRTRQKTGDFDHEFEYHLSREGTKTRFTMKVTYTPPGKLLGRIADEVFLRRYNENTLEDAVNNFKAICESALVAKQAAGAERRREPRPGPERATE
jgi:uncharacterized membrane protein